MRTIAICALIALAGCASTVERGLNAYNNGDMLKAREIWAQGAQAGDPAAIHNMGVLTSQGFNGGEAAKPTAINWFLSAARMGYIPSMISLATIQSQMGQRDAARSWMDLAARWNDGIARQWLANNGFPVPAPDLYIAKQQEDMAVAQALMPAAQSLGCAIGGGCRTGNASPPPNYRCTPNAVGSIDCKPEY